ncbi:hypothetical protein [Loktanella sp. R86503]
MFKVPNGYFPQRVALAAGAVARPVVPAATRAGRSAPDAVSRPAGPA